MYQDRVVRNEEPALNLSADKQPSWTPPPGIMEDFQSVRTLPSAIAAAAASETRNTLAVATSTGSKNSAEEMVRELVSSQRSFVRNLSASALQGLESSDSGLPVDQKALDAFRQQLEQMSDSRAIQTIPTSFSFPDEGADSVRVAVQISSDGSTVAASFPPVQREEKTKGYLEVWDTLSGIPLKQYEIDEPVRELHFSANEDCLLTMPVISVYRLFDNSAPRFLTHASSLAWSRTASEPVVCFTRQVGDESQEQLLALYDSRNLESLSIPMPEGFNTRARSIAFGNTDDKLAIAVSERGQDHKLFVCKTSDLARFEVLFPVDSIDGSKLIESEGGAGFAAVAFSPDDQTLLAIAHTSDGANGFSVRLYSIRNDNWGLTTTLPLPEGFAGSSDQISVTFVGTTTRVSIQTSTGVFIGDINASKKRRNESVWAISLDPKITRTVTLSDDGRWLAIGKSNGTIVVHDLSSPDPTLSVPIPAEGDTAHDGPVIGLSFSRPMQGTRTPTYIASFGRENRLKVWALIDLEEQFARARKAR
jgi:WD40 repeat protein